MKCDEIFAALAMLEKERGIPQTFMMDKIIQAVTTAYKRDHKDVENVIVDVDEEHQRLKMYVQKNVVAEEDYVDPLNEMSEEEAKVEAAKAVAIPGTSEHQLGLAVDLVDANMQDLTSAQESTETQKWLMANSWRYGFIHRYPNGKTDITGIIYEPWHYRYVGRTAAAQIHELGVTFEEYIDMFYK